MGKRVTRRISALIIFGIVQESELLLIPANTSARIGRRYPIQPPTLKDRYESYPSILCRRKDSSTSHRRTTIRSLFVVSNYLDDLTNAQVRQRSGEVKGYKSGNNQDSEITVPMVGRKYMTDIMSNKKRRASPAIDSDLLRFLSSTKSVTQLSDASEVSVNESEMDGIISKELDNSSENVQPSWMDQFHAENVARVLVNYDAGVDDALAAGFAVQNHAFERMRRRTINRFLQDRDELWATYQQLNGAGIEYLEEPSKIMNCRREGNINDGLPSMANLEKVVALLTESGCNGSDVAAIITHTPSIIMMRTNADNVISSGTNELETVGESLEQTINRVVKDLLFTTLNMRKNEVRKVLRLCPRLLTVKGSHEAVQVITLLSSLGSSTKSIVRDKRFLINMLSRTPTSLFRLVAFLTSSSICMRVKDIGPFLRKPGCIELLDSLCPSKDYVRLRLGSDPELSLLSRSAVDAKLRNEVDNVYKNATATSNILRNELGIDYVSKLLPAYPGILLLDPETDIFPVTDFLHCDLGMSELDIPKVLQTFPTLLRTNIDQMEETVDYLIELEVKPSSLAKIFRAFPAILSFDTKTQMEPVVMFLRYIGVVNVGRFITLLPSILGYSVEEDLHPKWDYINKVCGFDYFDLVRFPAFFSYPLSRIQSRYEYLRWRGIQYRLTKLETVLCFGDNDFATDVVGDKDGGKLFREFVKKRTQKRNKKKLKERGKESGK